LLYRPFLRDAQFWEDCRLITQIGDAPSAGEIECVYKEFVSSLWEWREVEQKSGIAEYFIQTLFLPYQDRDGNRPTETLLLSYARMLNPGDPQLLRELKDYRNELLRLRSDRRYSEITLLPEWQVGEI
jgi:hypothetical protein